MKAFMETDLCNPKALAVIGLGYVGLPLAIAFSKKRQIIGFDIDRNRIEDLRNGIDRTKEVCGSDLQQNQNISFTDDVAAIGKVDVYIVTVPTPVDVCNTPDFSMIKNACATVGSVLSTGNIVIFESTVYPGATREICVPILEQTSGLKFNTDFFCGYSPERINPGDQDRKIESVVKITSGSTPRIAKIVDALYRDIITAGTHLAESMEVAEAAKVIENTQRDINIALMNELAIIFDKLGLDTNAVLEAAGTKWNFLKFHPGLVGGHCIGVDPYYLTHKAKQVGFDPEIIASGRRTNEYMPSFIVKKIQNKLATQQRQLKGQNVLVLGLTFKENCPDFRNSKVFDVIRGCLREGAVVDAHDPEQATLDLSKFPDLQSSENFHQLDALDNKNGTYDVVLFAVPHRFYLDLGEQYLQSFTKTDALFFDLRSVFSISPNTLRL